MLEPRLSKPALIAVQLVAVGAVGAVALPAAWSVVPVAVLAGLAGGARGLGVAAVVGALAGVAYLALVIAATREVSVLGASGGRRMLWALLVMVGGTAGWALGWAVTDAAGLGVSRSPLWTFLLGGVPFALAAGVFLRGWRFRAPALALSVALIAAGVVVLRQEPPGELDARLAVAGMHRETAYVVAIPGYRPTDRDYGDGLGGGGFFPRDPDAVPPGRHITIIAYDTVVAAEQMCGQPTALDSGLTWGDCTIEPDGLVYRNNGIMHGYQVPVGRRYVAVVGTRAVEHDVLRAAALSLHPAAVQEIAGADPGQAGAYYAATVPGYTGKATGTPTGVIYTPADHTGNGAQSVAISLYVTSAAGDAACSGTTECTPEADGVTYVRTGDSHGYVVRHGEVDVQVSGGLRVDKALLRRAALDARPATDEELRRVLPPLPPRNPVDRLRHWLRRL